MVMNRELPTKLTNLGNATIFTCRLITITRLYSKRKKIIEKGGTIPLTVNKT